MNTVALHPALGGAFAWLFLMLLTKAIGKRVKPGRVSENVWDYILDGLTLLFAWQIALSLSQANLLQTLGNELRGLAETTLGGAGIPITRFIIGILSLAVALHQAYTFSRKDELDTAWVHLLAFTVTSYIASTSLPLVADGLGWLSNTVTVPLGNGITAGINYLLEAPH